MGNFLKNTNLTYSNILASINSRLATDQRFDNFRASSIASLIMEIFAGCSDLNNYNIERSLEECFVDTQLRKSSAILLAKNLAYDVTRPIPATGNISITLSGSMIGKVVEGLKLQLPVFSVFKYNDVNLILTRSFTYTFTETDESNAIAQGEDFSLVISEDDDGNKIEVCEGIIKTSIIEGITNDQVSQIFQRYRIQDSTFSNKYGSSDFSYYPVTRVWVGDSQTDDNEFTISRKSLLNDDVIDAISEGTVVKSCCIKTSRYEDIEIYFGNATVDGIGASIGASVVDTGGPSTTYDNIYIQYLSTKGSEINQTGIIDEILSYSDQILVNSQDVTDNIEFKFTTNLGGGADLESIDSIKYNSPNIFYSLDRLVSKRDYITYLKSLTSPINIKNAIAWGEQEEADAKGVIAVQSLFNIGLFSCIGSLYNLDGTEYSVKTEDNRLYESILDLDINEDGLSSQCYFNIYANNLLAKQLKEYVVTSRYCWLNNLLPITLYSVSYFSTTYASDTNLSFILRSFKYGVDISTTKTISVNLGSITTMNNIATLLQTALRAVVDTRSDVVEGVERNGNLNNLAFQYVTVTWDDSNKKFTITNSTNDPCYIDYFRYVAGSEVLSGDLGFYNVASGLNIACVGAYKNSNQNLISSAIIDTLALLNKRSQFPLKHIYVSPILQNFKITGNVYIKQLYDLNETKIRINNSIYTWLDTNADFGVSINKSNIIELIDVDDATHHSDISIVSKVPSSSSYNTFFHSATSSGLPAIGEYDTIDKYGIYATYIYQGIYAALSTYFTTMVNNSNYESFISSLSTYSGNNSGLTERKFIIELMKSIYDAIKNRIGVTLTETKFQDTTDFLTVMSDIHKDLSLLIRNNMIDSNGNIAPEYTVVQNDSGLNSKTYIGGGYSLGAEVAKVDLSELVYQYVS